ncbi:hypothetical protein BDQ12DRAFT_736641 [Crucibulum laeve]|uniref:Uncharacterized protein n=1 Tax=Crucibulum laeve TaxID=68775 RepID=A0A5C3LUX7_9AGAR|nr:hypothetical protein BDQ12DRAFT_736641 [Crucibulum laeve]
MAYYRTPMMAAEPYEESQGPESPVEASPDELKAFYQDMELRENLERKLSKRRSNSATSIWSRKSLKRSAAAPPPPVSKDPHTRPPSSDLDRPNDKARLSEDTGMHVDEHPPRNDGPHMNSPRSILPDTMKEIPTWYNKEAWAAVPIPAHKVRYHIYNPHGPRWYRNHHLIPPSQIKPGGRPPSFFSPSFPPISTSSTPERFDEPGPSATPSHSPLPTPTSSQTRVADGGKARSRKTSQTTPDNVDLLDVTDPWGTNWHHQSPYDLAISTSSPPDAHETSVTRPRRASMTAAQSLHKSVIPSPLFQSTSAIHLAPPELDGAHIPRKLSKRKTPAVGNIFGQTKDTRSMVASAPTTPVDHTLLSQPSPINSAESSQQLPQRMSVAPPIHSEPPASTSKKEKRGSVLGRLARKFSILRKPTDDNIGVGTTEDSWHHIGPEDTTQSRSRQSFVVPIRRSMSPEKPPSVDPRKRVPAPPAEDIQPVMAPDPPREHDRSSSISLETPFSIGKLTIANPDTPEIVSPSHLDNPPLPPEKPWTMDHNQLSSGSVASPPAVSLYLEPLVSISSDPPPEMIAHTSKSKMPAPSMQSSSSGPARTHSSPAPSHNAQEYVDASLRHALSPSTYMANLDTHSNAGYDRAAFSSPRTDASMIRSPESKTRSVPPPLQADNTLHIPFPNDGPLPPVDKLSSLMSYEDSPYSATSMLANPPTPYNARMSITATPESLPPPPLPPKSVRERKHSSREPSPIDKTASRQTETFKLVRSASGNVYASTETIVAAGQQWEVVESMDGKGKNRQSSSRSKDKESRKESKDREKEKEKEKEEEKEKEKEDTVNSKRKIDTDVDIESRQRSHRTSRQPPIVESTPSPTKPHTQHRDSSHKEEHRSSQRRDEKADERKSSRRWEEREDEPKSSRRRGEMEEEKRNSRKREEKEDVQKSSRKREEREEEKKSNRKRDNREEERKSGYRRDEKEDERKSHRRRDDKEDDRKSTRRRDEEESKPSRKRDDNDGNSKSSRRRDENRERRSERKASETGPTILDINNSQPVPFPTATTSYSQPLERRPSTSARPTSELPSAADMNAMRAKEAWEMERLWKARSMYGNEPNGAPNNYIPTSGSVVSDDTPTHGAMYGSSHTAFVVQTPFYGQPMQQIYHSMPAAPPPIIYSSPPSVPSIHDSVSSYEQSAAMRSYQPMYGSPPNSRNSSSTPRAPNPLPEPPRESPYQPAPLPPLTSTNGRPDYWTTKYTGITTTH